MGLQQRVAALEVNINNLFRASEHNTRLFQDTLHAQDIMTQVLQRVANDLQKTLDSLQLHEGARLDRVQHVTLSNGQVNYPHYIAEFYGVMGFSQFLGQHAAWQRAMEAPPPAPERVEEVDNVVVFGGDTKPGPVVLVGGVQVAVPAGDSLTEESSGTVRS